MRNDQRTIFGWAMYDWANSGYVVIAAGIIPAYFASVIVPEEGWMGFSAESLWGYMVGLISLGMFLITPVLGAIADYSARRLMFLRVFAFGGALFVTCFAFVSTGDVLLAIFMFLMSHFGLAASNVFYDGMLPNISTDDTIDGISSKGYAYGYVGSGVYLLLALVFIFYSENLGFGEDQAARLAIGGSGLWWAGFAWYAFRRMREVGEAREPLGTGAGESRLLAYMRLGFSSTWGTCRRLSGHKQLLLFIVAYMFYIDGVQTVISISAIYAAETLEISTTFIAFLLLVVQFTAFLGALMFGRLSDRIGPKRSVLIALVVWSFVLVAAYFLPVGQNYPLLALGVVIGVVMGGTQALSRSLYGSIIPEEASAEFFGFFSVFTKFSAIWGPIIFATFRQVTGSSRPGVLSLAVFFVVGFVLLSLVDVDKARAARTEWSTPSS
ncbi:MAG: MFS transporter [bacterium]|nr:MFS transporter [Acidimicrobiia bacterium]MCY4649564.1 MFS transporter [bacterium]